MSPWAHPASMGSHHQPPPRPCMRSSYLPPKAPQHGEAWLCILSLCCTPRPHRPLCWDPGCMFAVPLPCIREQLSHSQLLVPHPDQGSKAGTSPGSDCTNTLILHASHPHCLLSGVHTLLGACSSCPVFAHTRHSLSTLFPAPPPSQNLPEH